jgi:hypothetical protein
MKDIRTITDLKRHSKSVGDTFFSKGNARYFGSSRVEGVYRAPYTATTEGYVIAETIFTGSDGVSEPAKYTVYRFEAGDDFLDWDVVGKHDSLPDAEAFLRSMGAVK